MDMLSPIIETRPTSWETLNGFLFGVANQTRDLVQRQQAASLTGVRLADVPALLEPSPLDLDEMLSETCFPVVITGVSLERIVPPRARGSRSSNSKSTPSRTDNSKGDASASGDGPGSPGSLSTDASAPSGSVNRPSKRKSSNLNPFGNAKRQKTMNASLDLDADIDADIDRWRNDIGDDTLSTAGIGESRQWEGNASQARI